MPGIPDDNKIPYLFLPVPESVKKAIQKGKLKPIDGIVLGMLLRQHRVKGSCSAHLCTKKKIAAELGKDWQIIYDSFRRLKRDGWIEHFKVDCPDPDECRNSTGYRIRFPFIKRAYSHTTRTTGRFEFAPPGRFEFDPPCPPSPIKGTRGELRKTTERTKNDDNGCASAPQGPHDRVSSSSSFSVSSPRKADRLKPPVAELGNDQGEVDALAKTIATLFGWNIEDALARISGELSEGHSLVKIRNTVAEMQRQWDKIGVHDWGWICRVLRRTGPNGPTPPPPAKAAAATGPAKEARTIVSELKGIGVGLKLTPGGFECVELREGAGVVNNAMKRRIAEHKAALVELLSGKGR
jgi:hypothetical protein